MNYLYILSESDNDDLFFKGCIERITGRSFEIIPYRLRKGGGIPEVRGKGPVLLRQIKHTGPVDDTFFLIALDNDRSPVHPEHKSRHRLSRQDRRKRCRFCELETLVHGILGPREEWPIPGAVAVPVEMLESWLLLIVNPEVHKNEASLPIFSTKEHAQALRYYAPGAPPDQLKDLTTSERRALGLETTRDFLKHCTHALDPEDLAERAPSFALFKVQVDAWT
ncbi:hypothetical protein [Rhodocaloribacter sp.]